MLASIDTARLQAFREVAVRGSFTAAATALNVSQPAVSQQVARLERELGVLLLERTSRRVWLTAAGEVFLRHADQLLTGLDDARRELAALARAQTGRLRVIAFPSAAASFVPGVIAQLRAAYPGVNVAMAELDPPEALARLLAGDADLALVYDYPLVGGSHDPRLTWQTAGRDPMAVALRADSPLAARTEIPLAALADSAWIAPGASICRDALGESCRRAGFTPLVVSETNNYQAMLRMVGAGIGVAVVPRLVAGLEPIGTVALRPLASCRLERVISIVHRSRVASTPAMELMTQLLPGAVQETLDLADTTGAGAPYTAITMPPLALA